MKLRNIRNQTAVLLEDNATACANSREPSANAPR
jgi:hypothetical protein